MKRRGARAASELMKMLDDEGASIDYGKLDESPDSDEPAPDDAPLSEGPDSEIPESQVPPSQVPMASFVKRYRYRFVALFGLTAIVAPTIYRYFSMDPVLYAYRAAHAIAPFSSDAPLLDDQPADFLEALSDLDAEKMKLREEQASATLASLRQRFHPDDTHCMRYYGSGSPPNDDAVADAILEAGLAGHLNALVRTTARWEKERDDTLHGVSAADEVITYLAERGDVWTRVGVWMHHDEIVQRYRQLQEKRRVADATAGAPLPEALEPAARKLWEQHGQVATATLEVARRKRLIDLRSDHVALIAPNMDGDQVQRRLGTPMRAGHRWLFAELNLVVSMDDEDKVVRVARGLGNAANDVVAGDTKVGAERGAIEKALGEPLWRHSSGEGTTLVYDRGGHRLKLDFSTDTLASIELWRADMLLRPGEEVGDESDATKDDAEAM